MITLEQDIKDFVQEQIKQGKKFTAFNITKDLGLAAHRYVKPVVHQMFEDGEMVGYKREIDYSVKTDTGVQPFLYSPDNNVKIKFNNTITSNQTLRPAVISGTVRVGESGKRLRITKQFLKNIGANIGDTVYVYLNGGSIYISNFQNTKADAQSYTVDSKFNIRINLAKLKLKGSPNQELRCIIDPNNTIVI